MLRTLRGLNWFLLVAGLLLVAVTISTEADPGLGVFAVPLVGMFVAYAFLPFLAFGALNRRLFHAVPLLICALALAGLSAFWIWGFGSAFWWNTKPDAQDALILVVLPAYMIAASGIVAVAAWALDRYLR
jgi:uncharacterized membrane protein